MLRLMVNKARQHYNDALEHAERGRTAEAIDELHNSLDLDRRFANAHVVLGTLYAKSGEYEKARESWRNALEVQPDLLKAHNYLQKVEAVETSLPALRRFRTIALALLGVIALLTAGLFWQARPNPEVDRLRTAKNAYNEGNYGRAIKELETVRRRSKEGSAVHLAADSLYLALQADLRQEVRRIQDLTFSRRYPEALTAIADLETSQPDNLTSGMLYAIRQDIAHYYREELDRLYLDFEQGSVDYNVLAQQVERYLNLYPDLPERESLRNYLTRARELQVENEVRALREAFAQESDYQGTRQDLNLLMDRFPNSPALAAGRTDLVDEILTYMFERFQALVQQRKFDEAEAMLEDIRDASSEFRDVVDVSGPVELSLRVLEEARRNYMFRQVEELLEQERFDEADEAMLLLQDDPGLTNTEKDLLASYYSRIMEGMEQIAEGRIRRQLPDYLELDMTEGEASQTLRQLPLLEAATTGTKNQVQVYAAAIASAVKLNDVSRANRLLGALKELKPEKKLLLTLEKLVPEEKQDRPSQTRQSQPDDAGTTRGKASAGRTRTSDRETTRTSQPADRATTRSASRRPETAVPKAARTGAVRTAQPSPAAESSRNPGRTSR